MLPYHCDPEEIVMVPGRGALTARTAVREAMALPLSSRFLATLFRDRGKDPSILAISEIEKLAEYPEFM